MAVRRSSANITCIRMSVCRNAPSVPKRRAKPGGPVTSVSDHDPRSRGGLHVQPNHVSCRADRRALQPVGRLRAGAQKPSSEAKPSFGLDPSSSTPHQRAPPAVRNHTPPQPKPRLGPARPRALRACVRARTSCCRTPQQLKSTAATVAIRDGSASGVPPSGSTVPTFGP